MTPEQTERIVVVMDASVLINLIHARLLGLCSTLRRFDFVTVPEVLAEITRPAQRVELAAAIARGEVRVETLTTIEELERYVELTQVLGRGEAASLALAETRGWMIACDERRVFLREALIRVGRARIRNTAGLFVHAIRDGLLTISQADEAKALLEKRRFRLGFASFAEVVGFSDEPER